jgi:hypothetical protein
MRECIVKFPRSIIPKNYADSFFMENPLQGVCYLRNIHFLLRTLGKYIEIICVDITLIPFPSGYFLQYTGLFKLCYQC